MCEENTILNVYVFRRGFATSQPRQSPFRRRAASASASPSSQNKRLTTVSDERTLIIRIHKMARLTTFIRVWFIGLLLAEKASAQEKCFDAPPLEIENKHFFTLDGAFVPIRGIAYYPRPNAGPNDKNNIDFYTEEYRHMWERDVSRLRELNVNAIRIYAVDPGKNHDAFMCACKSAGIYVIIGLGANCANCSITSAPAPACYPPELKTRGEFIISVFSKYTNVLGFSAGNEVGLLFDALNEPERNGPCQKKSIRDMRAFIQSCSTMRKIPVGLAVADVERELNAAYYGCRSDPDDNLENAEWYGINTYQHCNSLQTNPQELTGFQNLLRDFSQIGLSIPVVLAEYGCINESFLTTGGFEDQRTFLQVETLFSPVYLQEFTGGFVFEYSIERVNAMSPWPFEEFGSGRYGVGYFAPENCDDINITCSYVPTPEFENLSAAYAAVSVNTPPASSARSEVTECPEQFPALSSFDWSSDSVISRQCPQPVTVSCPVVPGCGSTMSPNTTLTAIPTSPISDSPSQIPSTPLPTISTALPTASTRVTTSPQPTDGIPLDAPSAAPSNRTPTQKPVLRSLPPFPSNSLTVGSSGKQRNYLESSFAFLLVAWFL